ncbi:ribosomal protein S2, flavodoxin-like domain-containing protein [Polychytrium aggregatum]|uniref:ribosomal protein S2, flavodoxin-like domain-containing protein n=1 Tax=Polychytrium aggregatum TaxID=110093 RepID=UPI0022FDBA9F|nr:ribosomal protein S2, flavodoxin-like domain-containing protein [Polychytrium aggregatum]KAI9206584.1 ribosomal protein S2, flavodoxin-like domain-containing protein [Polychytrium aggregatum]
MLRIQPIAQRSLAKRLALNVGLRAPMRANATVTAAATSTPLESTPASAGTIDLAQLVPKKTVHVPSPMADFYAHAEQSHNNATGELSIKTLMAANVHLGHSVSSWNRDMLPYIYGERNGIHIINLEHTLSHLRRAVNVTREVARNGGKIVFVGTRPSIHRLTVDAALKGHAYFMVEWVGGTITNKERVLKRSVGFDPDKMGQVQSEGAGRGRRAKKNVEVPESDAGLVSVQQPDVSKPDLLVLLDLPNNIWAAREANQHHIPVIAICDTDCSPKLVTYPIPGNDDAKTSVKLIAGVLSLAAKEGHDLRQAAVQQEQYSKFDGAGAQP